MATPQTWHHGLIAEWWAHQAKTLQPTLWTTALHELDPARRYRTIFCIRDGPARPVDDDGDRGADGGRRRRARGDETHAITILAYLRDELLLMLERAGFADIEVYGDQTLSPPTPESGTLTFAARA